MVEVADTVLTEMKGVQRRCDGMPDRTKNSLTR